MITSVSDINFEGGKTPKLQLRRKEIKNLQLQKARLTEDNKLLKANLKELGDVWQKVTELPPNHPDAPKVSKLWRLRFYVQYSFINGSYKEYKNAKKSFAQSAVENYSLMKFVNNPIKIKGGIPIFSKPARNMMKNALLDKFRIKTPAEKQLKELAKADAKQKAMKNTLGIK